MGKRRHRSTLDHTIRVLSQRDGVDKVLKTARYVALSYIFGKGESAVGEESSLATVKALESSLGVTRKALRLGKFLTNAKKIADLWEEEEPEGDLVVRLLSITANCSEGIYYFLDQLQFLVKAKVVKKSDNVATVKRAAAVAEMSGLAADTVLCLITARSLQARLMALDVELSRPQESPSLQGEVTDGRSEDEIDGDADEARAALFEAKVAIVQNLADFVNALNDVRERDTHLGDPRLLSLLGLLSGLIGLRAKWVKA